MVQNACRFFLALQVINRSFLGESLLLLFFPAVQNPLVMA